MDYQRENKKESDSSWEGAEDIRSVFSWTRGYVKKKKRQEKKITKTNTAEVPPIGWSTSLVVLRSLTVIHYEAYGGITDP